MSAPARQRPELTVGPVVALVVTMLAGLAALYLAASAWTFGNLPESWLDVWPALRSVGLYLAFGAPVAAVIAVGIFVGRSRWRGPALALPWGSRRASSGAEP
jgi:hypothetical protein